MKDSPWRKESLQDATLLHGEENVQQVPDAYSRLGTGAGRRRRRDAGPHQPHWGQRRAPEPAHLLPPAHHRHQSQWVQINTASHELSLYPLIQFILINKLHKFNIFYETP